MVRGLPGLIFTILLCFGARAHDSGCQERLVRVDSMVALRFLSETVTADLKLFAERIAKEHAPFRQWLTENGIRWNRLNEGGKYDQLAAFFGVQLAPYTDEVVEARRRAQLAGELIHRGAPHGPPDGYAILKELSQTNYRRLLNQFKDKSGPVTDPGAKARKEIEEAVNQVTFAFIHNTTRITNPLTKRPTFPLLSSRELVGMGITEKLNTKPFNAQVLQSDGNVFFFAVPYVRGGPFPKVVSTYGQHSLIVENSFADETGWISPYVMNPEDLVKLGEQLLPEELAQVRAAAGRRALNKWGLEQWQPLIAALSRYDLRPSDYLKLIRETLKHSLLQLRAEDPEEFKKVLAEVKAGDNLTAILTKHSLGKIGIRFDSDLRTLELKVPVSVPVANLEARFEPDAFDAGQLPNYRGLPPAHPFPPSF